MKNNQYYDNADPIRRHQPAGIRRLLDPANHNNSALPWPIRILYNYATRQKPILPGLKDLAVARTTAQCWLSTRNRKICRPSTRRAQRPSSNLRIQAVEEAEPAATALPSGAALAGPEWLPPDKFSFPSGHTMTAFSIALVVSYFYPSLEGCCFLWPQYRGVAHRAWNALPQRRAGGIVLGCGAGVRFDYRVCPLAC